MCASSKAVKSTHSIEESCLTSIQGESDSSSIYLYIEISLNFQLQVSCKYAYFTFTSSSAHPRKGRGNKENQLSKVGCAIKSTKE